MDTKKVTEGARQIREHQEAVRKVGLCKALELAAKKLENAQLTPREREAFRQARAAESRKPPDDFLLPGGGKCA